MRAFNITFIIIFFLFAALQYNDPDPYIWIPIYLYAAFLCYQAVKHKYNSTLYFIGFIAYLGYAAYLLFDKTGVLAWAGEHHSESIIQTMQAEKPWIEETREFGGLVIVLLVLLINIVWLRKSNKVKPSYI